MGDDENSEWKVHMDKITNDAKVFAERITRNLSDQETLRMKTKAKNWLSKERTAADTAQIRHAVQLGDHRTTIVGLRNMVTQGDLSELSFAVLSMLLLGDDQFIV